MIPKTTIQRFVLKNFDKFLFLLFALIFALISSCGGKVQSFTHSPSDTIKTVGMWREVNGALRWDYMIRLQKDTFTEKQVDSSTKKKVWLRDTLYFTPIVDTVVGVNGRPLFDSVSKQPVMGLFWVPLKKDFLIVDFNKSIK